MNKVLLVAALVAFCVCALTGSPGYAQEKSVTLKYSSFFPAPHKNSILSDQWCKEVEKRTNGRVKFNYFPGATLTPAAQTYDSVVKGIADVGFSVLGYTRGKFPLTEVIDLPLGYKNGYTATKLINEYYRKFKPKELDEVQVMYLHAHGPGILHTAKKPVRKMEDMKGLKVRSHGLSAKVVQALGGAPVGMPMTETYDAISKGVAEGVMCPFEAMKGWKLGEVVGYTTENYGSAYTTGFFVVMNKSKWNAISPADQKTIMQINEEWIDKQGKVWDEIDKEGKDLMIQMKKTVIPLSKEEDARWAKQVQPILDDYVKGTKAKGLPGDQALKFCLDYLKANQK
ncbi:MAG: 2,3-diketo-L-gulonate-binding periplasmic protein YiaO precursor [Syntrophorhabdaceae bacterium PtaU1.Bin034]|nr:MAG: 2,3-diketo-L-gulonate-binding periplasmic protein YiaO precursor [Syntrophorhabdaceae bacterium PtaU1.Bin034]